MNWLRLAIQWSTFNRVNTNLNKSVYAARRSFTSHHSYFSLLQPCRKHQKYIAQIMLASYLSMPGVLLAQGVSAAANSVHAPSFDTAANGTPIVNINAPSSKGVSRNEYNELNVDTKGLIFNNATDIVNTQLAGFIDGNSRLNGNSANIILNEVKGNSRSALNGYMEIAGRSAELVIANQNGITCNGCGFINTTRGTLTTGLPTFDGAGGLTGFDVSRGDVDISGLGLNASNVDEVDILARSVSLNSKLWAKNATIVTGQNHINYQDKKVTAALGSSGSGISLDVAAIGGMYANRIRLIGTEKGLGVNIAGEIKAVEDMTLDSQGNLSNSGTISAKTLAVSSKGINNTGNMLGNSISIDADLLDNNTNTANIQAVNSVSIKLKDGLKNRDGARILSKDGLISIESGSVYNQSSVAANRIIVNAGSLTNNTSDGQIISSGRLDLTLTGNANNTDGAMIHADKALTLNASGDLINTDATIETIDTATINSQNLTSSGIILAENGTLTVKTNKLDNQGALSGNGITLTATELKNSTAKGKILSSDTLGLTLTGNANNTDGAMIHADKALTLSASGDLVNTDSTIETVETATINSQNLTNSGTILAQNGTLSITNLDGSLNNQGGIVGDRVIMNAADVSNAGSNALILGQDYLDIRSTGNITNQDGAVLYSFGDGVLKASSTLTNSSATIETGKNLAIEANQITNKKSIFSASQNVTSQSYTGVGIGVPGGYYAARRNYTATTTTPILLADSNQAYILSGGDMSIMGKIDNIYSTVSAVGSLSFTASQLNNVSHSDAYKTVSTGTDYLDRTWETCKRNWYGKKKCSRHYATDTRGYNNTTSSAVSFATATFTAGGNITGKAGAVDNKGKVDANNEDMLKVRRDEIFGGDLVKNLVSSALFKESDSPDQKYLIETNPLFTNYKTFISSDYLLSKMLGDEAGRTGKTASRLGDGYLEQQLVRDQILSYTGYQTLPDEMDIEATYAVLMNNAVEEYQGLGLSTGVELSAAQISQLQKPIVWMVIETVQTASGPQQVLVPKVYFSNTSEIALRPDGALIAAANINIDAQDGIANSGSMLAKVDLSIKGSSIDNGGTIKAGENASINASENITNSGSLEAGGSLGLVAGGNITSETKTQVLTHQRGNHSATETLVDTTATLKGNNISLSAGNDITLKGTDVSASEQVFASAGNNFTLESLAVTNSSKDGNYYDSSSTTQQVSSVSGKDIQLSAGNKLTSQGAQINATDNLELSAKNIDLLAVKDINDNYSFLDGGGNSTKTRTHDEAITGTELNSGGTLSLASQEDIFSKGSTLNGGTGIALAAGGDVILATETAQNTNFQEIKTRSSGFWGTKTSTKTTTSDSLTNQGTNLTSGGDIQMVSGSDIVLSGTKATAAGVIDLQAKGDIQLLSAVDQTSSRYQEEKKGTFKVKTKDQGSIKQTAVTSELIANGTSGEGNIALTSGRNITLEGATLAANDTLSMGASADTQEAVSQDANGNYVNALGEQVGNVTVGTQALQSSEWNESSSGFRGILKDLARGVSVVASSMGIEGEIKVGESHATRIDTLKQKTSTLAANDLNIDAQNDVALIGANVAVTDTASINAQNVTIDAAQEQTVVSESHTDHTISSEGATLEKDQISLVSLIDTKHTEKTTTTANTWAGSNISAGNLSINANQNVAIIASDVNVQNNADIQGENILVGGREATTDTTHDSVTKTKTLTVGVKNAYVDVVLAIQALKDAKDAVGDAKDAYDEAKVKVAEGRLPASDLDFYKVNLAAATANVASATTAVTSAGATAAASTATYGFTINGGVTTQTDTTSTTSTQGTWNGSNINVGGNTSLASNNNLNIEGSNINTAGQLALDASNINITAGKNTYTESIESRSEGESASYGSSGGFGGGINGSKSQSDSQSVQHVNSGLSAGSIVSNSNNLTIEGGNLNAEDIDITTDKLVVTSLQDTSTSSSKSSGGSVGIGSSNNVGINASQSNADSAWVNQQSGITGGTVNITAKDTTLTGAVIAAVDEEGNSTDKLTLTTDTLTVADLQDSDNSKSMGIDLSLSKNTTKVGGSFNGHEKEQTTKATIGLGNVTVGGLSIEESIDQQPEFANLNRDAANSQEITKDMERGGVDISLTVDNRMLTEKGRDQIAEDILKSDMLVDTAVLAATTDRVGLLDFNEELGKTHTVYETVKEAIANDKVLAKQLQDPNLSTADKEVMLDQLTHAVMSKLGYETEGYENKIIADETATGGYEDGSGGKVAGFHSNETRDSYINDVNIDSTELLVNAAAHESSHEMDVQDSVTYSQSDNEAYANNFGSNFASYTNLALDINGYDSSMATTNNHVGNNTPLVLANTAEYNSLDKEQGDNWNMGPLEMNPFHIPMKGVPEEVKRTIQSIKPEHMTSAASTAVGVAAIFNPFAKILAYVGVGADVTTTYLTRDPINMLPGFMGQGVKTALKGGKLSEAVLERTGTITSLGTSEILSE